MKRTIIFLILGIIILIIGYNLLESFTSWAVPDQLHGEWIGNLKVAVRFNNNGKFTFVTAPDTVNLNLIVKENGDVSGIFGAAAFESCSICKNRGWISKRLNLGTDYIISGNLTGAIFPTDTIVTKRISFPFNMENHIISGSMFQKQGMGVFPMADIRIIKK